MAKGSELTPGRKAVIVALSNEGFSSRSITQRISFDHSTVVRLLRRYRETGS